MRPAVPSWLPFLALREMGYVNEICVGTLVHGVVKGCPNISLGSHTEMMEYYIIGQIYYPFSLSRIVELNGLTC